MTRGINRELVYAECVAGLGGYLLSVLSGVLIMDTWTNLLSGFVGAIIGGLITLLGTWLAMRQERALVRQAALEDRRQFREERSQSAARELMTLAIGPLQDAIGGLPYGRGGNPFSDLHNSISFAMLPLIEDGDLRSRFINLLNFLVELEELCHQKKIGSDSNILMDCRQKAATYLVYVTRSLRAYLAGDDLPPQEELARDSVTTLGQLDSDSVDIRISGIHKLGQMADELDDWATVTNVLADCVKLWTPLATTTTGRSPLPRQPPLNAPIDSVSLSSWAPDAQVALSVIGRRKPTTKKLSTAGRAEVYYEKFNLWLVDLRGADLRNAEFEGVSFGATALQGANMRGINMKGVDLRRAYLSGVDLSEADLRKADLRKVDLSGGQDHHRVAKLTGADLRGADVRGANIGRAEIKGAKLENAIASPATIWPQEFKPEDHGIIIRAE